MRNRVWMKGICWLVFFGLALCSCSLEELLQEVPRDYAISGTAPRIHRRKQGSFFLRKKMQERGTEASTAKELMRRKLPF